MAFAAMKLKHNLGGTDILTFALCILVMLQTFFSFEPASVSPPPFSHPRPSVRGGVRLIANISARNPRGTIFTCVTPSFYYTKHFLYSYTGIGFDVRVYEADSVRLNGNKFPIHWCRVRLLAKDYDIGPAPLLYSDADTRVNVTELEKWITPYLDYDGLIIMNGTERRPHEIRTNWFVLPVPKGPRTMKVLRNWASHARDVGLQDQLVINELYPRCDDNMGILCRHYQKVGIESWHCGSHNRSRASCMHDTIHLKEKIPKYRKSL